MPREHAVTQGTDAQEDWPEILDSNGVQYLVLDIKADARLLQQFRTKPQWRVDLKSQTSMLLARTGTRLKSPSTAGPLSLQGVVDR
jgi:hypothetical protein